MGLIIYLGLCVLGGLGIGVWTVLSHENPQNPYAVIAIFLGNGMILLAGYLLGKGLA